ncbi:hypothetical protein DMB65_10570 [Flavobacterium cheongpyeongense]|uniref:GmrSD restriction endonucleases N-terminal domain-containing protein n=1 Tax=Flavobacterium cheongpyeongense TaxID=2212651 RepID=A0A2V4BQ59_9FLAO|nr:DUF262 domain-containing protein [Flavobacterium cheongpyeongense]PXY40672.1 hypothetical protein DMB65_10570 [Flavobacterium cheongpyeongense]
MSTILSLETTIKGFDYYIRKISNGEIQIPEFQRDFIWELDNVINLLESIKKNYPIGSFLFWKPIEKFGITKDIGPYELDETQKVAFEKINCQYVLDGYQRISTLFGCLINPSKNSNFILNKKVYDNTFKIFYNLDSEEFETFRGVDKDRESFIVPIYIILDNFDVITQSEKIYKEVENNEIAEIFINRLKRLNTSFTDYKLPSIEIEGGELQEAIDIFTLLNKEGKPISPDWILSAKTYTNSFRLGTLIDEVLEELEQFNFYDKKPRETATRELVFRSIQSSFGTLYLDNKKTDVITLSKKPEFVEVVQKTAKSIIKATKFLFEELLVVDGKLLPAGMQFIFLVEFFNYVDEPSPTQIEKLKEWFWITSFSNYFTIYNPAKRKEAFRVFQEFAKGKIDNPLFNDKPSVKFVVPDLPNKITLGSVRAKTYILFLLNYSNNFNKINFEEVEGYKISKLLSHTFEFSPFFNLDNYNIIVKLDKIDNDSEKRRFKSLIKKKTKDLSYLLDVTFVNELDNLFIDEKMINEYKEKNVENVLSERESLITAAEKSFVEKLNLDHNYFPF